jgi:type IV pilus assembly protein PilE
MIFEDDRKKPSVPGTHGFSLIELLVVMVIVAMLAVIAIPAYGRYALRAHRVDGQAVLLHIADAQERFYASNNHYGALTDIGYTDPAVSEQKYYSVTSVVSADPAGNTSQAYVATATPTGAQARDACAALTIANTGIKTLLPSSAAATSNGSCW